MTLLYAPKNIMLEAKQASMIPYFEVREDKTA